MTQELVQSVKDILENANSQFTQLTDLGASLKEAKAQISESAELSRKAVKSHFSSLRQAVEKAIAIRVGYLLEKIDIVEENTLTPLLECEDIVNDGLKKATNVMNEGKTLLLEKPDDNIENVTKFKDHPDAKHLESIPEIPDLSDVPFLSLELTEGVNDKITELISSLGKIRERAPVQISEVIERPGGIHIKWGEVEDDTDFAEFSLQYCLGKSKSNTDKATFHVAYTGPGTCHTVKQLKQNTMYSFRVRGRTDQNSNWCEWTVPRPAMTTIPHYQWSKESEAYSVGNEDRTATRLAEGLTSVLYSKSHNYVAGLPITFRVIRSGEKTPFDGVGFAVNNDNTETLQRKNAIFVATSGVVYVDSQEMTTKLPAVTKKSKVNIETEVLSNGKIRVSVEVDGKVVTFDWKIEQSETESQVPSTYDTSCDQPVYLYFGMKFSHEDWIISVE